MALAQPLDRLKAINIMLAGAGEMAANTLEDDGVNDTDVAKTVLDASILKVFLKGWDFNTTVRTFTPASDGTIVITGNYFRVDGENKDYGRRFTVRSNLLYDLDNDTNVFTTSVDLKVVQNLEFEDIPLATRFYITAHAARSYQMKSKGDTEADGILAKEEYEAWEDMKKHDFKTRDQTWITRSRDSQASMSYRDTARLSYDDSTPL